MPEIQQDDRRIGNWYMIIGQHTKVTPRAEKEWINCGYLMDYLLPTAEYCGLMRGGYAGWRLRKIGLPSKSLLTKLVVRMLRGKPIIQLQKTVDTPVYLQIANAHYPRD